jgi:hypothetical protein
MSRAEAPARQLQDEPWVWVVIYSGEHGAYWRPNACGYTKDIREAGRWGRHVAERMVAHCGPEKRIELRDGKTGSRAALEASHDQ